MADLVTPYTGDRAEWYAHCAQCADHTCLWHTLKTVTFSSP